MQYTEKELSRLIEDVEKEFSAHLSLAKSESASPAASQEQPLAKAEEKPEEKKQEPKEKKPESEEKPKEEAPKEEAAPSEAPKEEAPKEEAAPEESKEAAPAPEAQAAAGHDYDDEDLEHMHKMYMSMGEGELKAHHDAIKKCLDSRVAKCGDIAQEAPENIKESPESHVDAESAMGKSEAQGVDKVRASGGKIEASAPPKEAPGAKSPASKVEGVQMEKSETGTEVELLKSELEVQKTKSNELKKNLDAVTEFLTKLVEKTAPKGKAITSLDAIAKSEASGEEVPLNKSEINAILAKKAADPGLAKADRELINAYCLNNASVNSISHLLKQ